MTISGSRTRAFRLARDELEHFGEYYQGTGSACACGGVCGSCGLGILWVSQGCSGRTRRDREHPGAAIGELGDVPLGVAA